MADYDDDNIISRTEKCAGCGAFGCWVDTTAGEIIENGAVIGYGPPWDTQLLVDPDGELRCSDCTIVDKF